MEACIVKPGHVNTHARGMTCSLSVDVDMYSKCVVTREFISLKGVLRGEIVRLKIAPKKRAVYNV